MCVSLKLNGFNASSVNVSPVHNRSSTMSDGLQERKMLVAEKAAQVEEAHYLQEMHAERYKHEEAALRQFHAEQLAELEARKMAELEADEAMVRKAQSELERAKAELEQFSRMQWRGALRDPRQDAEEEQLNAQIEEAQAYAECAGDEASQRRLEELLMQRERLAYKYQVEDIGRWGQHQLSPGVRFLNGDHASAKDACAILSALGAPGSDLFKCHSNVLSSGACKMLINEVDVSCPEDEGDFKLELSLDKLIELIGHTETEKLLGLFGGTPTSVKIRRASASSDCINFHLDVSSRTMQVALNGEDEYSGGRLMFCTTQGLVCPIRQAGTATIHDCNIVHGVSTHTTGIRYGLFFLEEVSSAA